MSVSSYNGDPKDPTDDTPFDALKEKSLKAAGISYLVGDAALFASGMMSKRYKEARSGAMYAAGGLICAHYGNPSAEKQLQRMCGNLGKYLSHEGVSFNDSPDRDILTQKDGAIERIESFLYQYPAQIFNTMSLVGATQLLRSGLQHKKNYDVASGALVCAGALSGLLIPEKKLDPENAPKTVLGKAASWLQEKPLRISGGLYALNNVALLASAFKEMKTQPTQKSYLFKFLTAASFMFGNGMLLLTSKDNHGQSDANMEAVQKLAEVSARVIAAQPKPMQEALLQHISGYLSAQPEIHMSSHDITDMLHKKMGKVVEVAPLPAVGDWTEKQRQDIGHLEYRHY